MRIGFGATVLAMGLHRKRLDGIGVYSQALWREFQHTDNDFFPLVFQKGADVETLSEVLGREVTCAPLPYEVHSGISALIGRAVGELARYEKKIDLFFAPDHHIPYLKHTPVVATVMDLIPLLHPEWASSRLRKAKNFAFKRAILSASHIVTISEHSRNDLIDHLGISKDDISVVPLGVDQSFFRRADASQRKRVLDDHRIGEGFFLFVGTLQPRKNVLRIVKAYRSLPEHVRRDHALVIVGQYGWGSDELMQEIDALVRSNEGRWLSYVPQDDLLALMQSACALVYPSLYEGFGLPIVEGFASQCPVITSNTTSMPEVAGDAALLVDPFSVDQIAHAMQRAAEDAQLRQTLVELGLKRVKAYTWQASAKKHMRIFEQVAGR
jgi:glycosyltransferase involved in cell wall biosynthesis